MKLSEFRQLLAARGIQLTKSLGQNFLHDGNQLRRIVEAAELAPADKVLEIGPGLGPLTESLLAAGADVLAIEKDARLLEILRERLGTHANLRLLHDDALAFLRRGPHDWAGWKVVSNLPYSVASPILVELAQAPAPPERITTTLQLEVAQRLMAKAGTEHYGVLTLLMQLRYATRGWFRISAGCFWPEPDVDSACVTLVRRAAPLAASAAEARVFERLVKLSFSQRRKMMLNLLKSAWPDAQLEALFRQVGLEPRVRAEVVSLEQFAALSRLLSPDVAAR